MPEGCGLVRTNPLHHDSGGPDIPISIATTTTDDRTAAAAGTRSRSRASGR